MLERFLVFSSKCNYALEWANGQFLTVNNYLKDSTPLVLAFVSSGIHILGDVFVIIIYSAFIYSMRVKLGPVIL